jgi:hypothetical protein
VNSSVGLLSHSCLVLVCKVKVKLLLCLLIKHCAMKAYGEWMYIDPYFLDLGTSWR